ncbi:MAG: PD-(D/E)XK nuclease family protein [Bacilli bacterium]|nr:PD-(D/E)XK nuclease family protein [Bacilli bacterium]
MLIISRREYFPLLYRAKEKNPALNFKLIDKAGLLDLASYSFMKDAVPLLMKKGISYNRAKKFLNILRVRKPGADRFLDELEEELERGGYLFHDPLGKAEINSMDIVLFRLDKDEELKGYLERNGISYKTSDDIFGDLGPRDMSKMPPVFLFPNKFTQYMYVFSDIRKRIKEAPSLIGNIAVHAKDESDFFYIKLIASLFGLPYYKDSRRKLLSYPAIKAGVKGIFEAESFALPEGEGDLELQELKTIIDHYGLKELDFDFAYASLLEILSSSGVKEDVEKRGIAIVTDFSIVPGRLTYITDFQFGDFYREFDDKNVYPDARIVEIGANPSYILTEMDKRLKIDYLSLTDFPFLSRVKEHLQDSIYNSQLISELGWDEKKVQLINENPSGVYTTQAALLFQADDLDRRFIHAPIGNIMSYDRSFKGIGAPLFPKDRNWSVTKLEQYISCPFRFLMGVMIPEQEDGDYYLRAFGTAAHKLFEDMYHADFDFDASMAKAEEEFKKYLKGKKAPYTDRYDVLLSLAKYWLGHIAPILRGWVDHANLIDHRLDAEQEVHFTLTDDAGNSYRFAGRIDKIVWTRGKERDYYTIIDYKTGAECFNPYEVFLGKSTQLPIYYWALTQPDNIAITDGASFGGFGIQHIYFKTPKQAFVKGGEFSEGNLRLGTRIEGALCSSADYVSSFDDTALGKDGVKSTGQYANFKCSFADLDNDSILKDNEIKYTMNDLVKDAQQALVDTIKKIEAGEFPIEPTIYDLTAKQGMSVCGNCPYSDVCYRVLSKDSKEYYSAAKRKFTKKEEEA